VSQGKFLWMEQIQNRNGKGFIPNAQMLDRSTPKEFVSSANQHPVEGLLILIMVFLNNQCMTIIATGD